jgi:hypothetical protein
MKLLLLFAFMVTAANAVAQEESPVPDFICTYTGKLLLPYGFPKSSNLQKVKSCSILSLHTFNREGETVIDSSVVYKSYYTPNGDKIGLESSYAEFKGFDSLGYNKDGALAFKVFETFGIRGCSNYHWAVGGKVRYDYEYEQGHCTKVITGKNHFIQHKYNRNNQLVLTEEFYKLSDTSVFENSEYSFAYRYDKQKQLTDAFTIGVLYNNAPDSLRYLPNDMAERLYRQSSLCYDSVLLRDYGLTEDSMEVEANIPPALLAVVKSRDSMDQEWITIYKRLAVDLSAYAYNKEGQVIQRITFNGEDIDKIETFTYNDKGLLVTWDEMQDYSTDWNHWSVGRRLTKLFEYNDDQQVVKCALHSYTGQERTYAQMLAGIKEPLKTEFETIYNFGYDKEGKMEQMTTSGKHWYYFTTDSPVTYEPETYYMRYELF